MSSLLPTSTGPLQGTLRVPGDKSISHRAALFGLIAGAPCRATNWLDAADTRCSLAAVRDLGCAAEFGDSTLQVAPGPWPKALAGGGKPRTLDCGNSGTTARLLLGLLAARLPQGGPGVLLTGDVSLRGRPMGRVIDPLRAMGADIQHMATEGRLPVLLRGADLQGIVHRMKVPSAQAKSALLLAGLQASGRTEVHGGGSSRDHTERLLRTMGVELEDLPQGGVAVTGGQNVGGFDIAVPGDPSSAAFFWTAAAMLPGSSVTVTGCGLNEGRVGALRVLRRAGVQVTIDRARGPREGEMLGDVTVAYGTPQPFTIDAVEMPTLVDEIPVLAVLATSLPGQSVITGAAELRLKESDRLALVAANLQRLGAQVEEQAEGLVISGPVRLKGGTKSAPLVLETGGDHRLAMALAIAALGAEGRCALDAPGCVDVSYPDFFTALDGLLAGD